MGRPEFENDIVEFIGLATIGSQSVIVEPIGAKSSWPNWILTMVHVASKFESNVAERFDAQLVHTWWTKCQHSVRPIVCQWQ